jgi:hypothetical protein
MIPQPARSKSCYLNKLRRIPPPKKNTLSTIWLTVVRQGVTRNSAGRTRSYLFDIGLALQWHWKTIEYRALRFCPVAFALY